mmetsp:Transcript_98076/g.282135  ORF Transcript_98076/g.282135 Transcript_98076/m.282135 type:complete len:231 (-) Transcript_98076:516-1208(-)
MHALGIACPPRPPASTSSPPTSNARREWITAFSKSRRIRLGAGRSRSDGDEARHRCRSHPLRGVERALPELALREQRRRGRERRGQGPELRGHAGPVHAGAQRGADGHMPVRVPRQVHRVGAAAQELQRCTPVFGAAVGEQGLYDEAAVPVLRQRRQVVIQQSSDGQRPLLRQPVLQHADDDVVRELVPGELGSPARDLLFDKPCCGRVRASMLDEPAEYPAAVLVPDGR